MSDAVVDDGHRDSNWTTERKDMDAISNAGAENPDNGGDYHASSDANVGSGSKGEQPAYQKQLKVLGSSCSCVSTLEQYQ